MTMSENRQTATIIQASISAWISITMRATARSSCAMLASTGGSSPP
jgi:hypothetical protein